MTSVRLERIVVLCALLVLPLLALRWTGPSDSAVTPPVSARSAEQSANRSREGRTRTDDSHHPVGNDGRVHSGGDPSEGRNEAIEIPPRSGVEGHGVMQFLRDAVEEQPLSAEVSRRQLDWAEQTMSRNERIRELDMSIVCSASICRAEFLFENVLQARELARLIMPASFTVMSEHERTVEGLERVVSYWAVDDFDLRGFVQTELLDQTDSDSSRLPDE